jgi:hypothetical protein
VYSRQKEYGAMLDDLDLKGKLEKVQKSLAILP